MSNPSTSFFYWYRRYKVKAADMTAFQTAMVETARVASEGAFGAAVLSGLEVNLSTGMVIQVSGGIAVSPSGYACVLSASGATIDCSSATGASPTRSLIVLRPNPVDASYMASPTSPFSSVPLNQNQQCQVVLIPGTPSATPAYPSKLAGDVILMGLTMPASTTTLDSTMIDLEQREQIGLNSNLGQATERFDNRLRPYLVDYRTVGIKPSQTFGSIRKQFLYGPTGPVVYPLSASVFNPVDATVNMGTGAIGGGDATSSSFTPTIPTSGNSIVALVGLTRSNTISVKYGTQGTLAQCLAAIESQTTGGAGGIPTPAGILPVAYVLVTSVSGAISRIRVIDARPVFGGLLPTSIQEQPSGTVNGVNTTFTLSQTPVSAQGVNLYEDSLYLRQTTDYTISGKTITMTTAPASGQDLWAKYEY